MRTSIRLVFILWLISLSLILMNAAVAANHVVQVGITSDGDYGEPGEQLMVFFPAQLTITAGDTVTFISEGGMPHNVHADDNSFRCAEGCDDDGGDGDPSSQPWSVTLSFDTPRTIGYRCDAHFGFGMVGSITVVAGSTTSPGIGGFTSGNWFNPDFSGMGFQIEATTAIDAASGLPVMVVCWFTFAPDEVDQSWVYAQGVYDPLLNTVTLPAFLPSGTRFPPNFVQADVQAPPWGTLSFSFSDCNNGTATWNSTVAGYGSGSMPITRLTQIAGTECPTPAQ
jgi:plastocyanin